MEEDILQDEMGFNTGQLGEDTGHVRAMQSTQRKLTVSKKLQVPSITRFQHPSHAAQKEMQKKLQTHGGLSTIRGTNTSGLASVAFTPFQASKLRV